MKELEYIARNAYKIREQAKRHWGDELVPVVFIEGNVDHLTDEELADKASEANVCLIPKWLAGLTGILQTNEPMGLDWMYGIDFT